MLKPFKRHGREEILQTPIFRLHREKAEHPRSGHVGSYYILEVPDWVNIIARTSEGEFLLVRQWRHGSSEFELELPAGALDEGETPEEAAARELQEETGFVAEKLTLLGSAMPNCAYQSNRCYSVLAEGCRPNGGTKFDPGEDIELVKLPFEELARLFRNGTVRNGMGICAMFFWLDQSGKIDWNK